MPTCATLSGDDLPALLHGTRIAEGALLHARWRYVEAEAVLAAAAAGFPPHGFAEQRLVLEAALAATAASRGRLRESDAALREGGIVADGATFFPIERIAVDVSRVQYGGGYADALPRWSTWIAESRAWQDEEGAALLLVFPAAAAWLAGDDEAFARWTAEIEQVRNRALGRHDRRRYPGAADEVLDTWTSLRFIDVALRSENVAQARRIARTTLESAERTGIVIAIVVTALVNAALDDVQAPASVDRARRAAELVDVPSFRSVVTAFAAGQMERTGTLHALAERLRRSPNAKLDAVRVRLFANEVSHRDAPVPVRDRELEVLAALALAGGTLPRETLAEQLWPGAEPSAAAAALRASIHRLRRALEDDDVVVSVGSSYRLSPRVSLDIAEAETFAGGLRILGALEPEDLPRLRDDFRALTSGTPAFVRWSWFAMYEPRILELRHHVAMLLAGDAMHRGEPNEALAYAEVLLQLDPVDEPANELAIRAHVSAGRSAEALRRFRLYRETLRREFGIEPPRRLGLLAEENS